MYNTARKENEGTAYDAVHASHWLGCELNSKVNAFERFQAEQFPTEAPPASTCAFLPDIQRYIERLSIPQETSEGNGQDTLTAPLIGRNWLEILEKIEIIAGAIAIARIAGFDDTANRLGQILLLFQEELEPDEQPLSLSSLKQFIRFLIEHRGLREPSIVVTDRGNVKAIWEYSEKQIFWIEFYPSGDVRYLAFVPNERRSDGIERTASWSTASDVFDRAKSLGATAWMVL